MITADANQRPVDGTAGSGDRTLDFSLTETAPVNAAEPRKPLSRAPTGNDDDLNDRIQSNTMIDPNMHRNDEGNMSELDRQQHENNQDEDPKLADAFSKFNELMKLANSPEDKKILEIFRDNSSVYIRKMID